MLHLLKLRQRKFTEVGYVGRDVEQIIRDLVEASINKAKIKMGNEVQAQMQKKMQRKKSWML